MTTYILRPLPHLYKYIQVYIQIYIHSKNVQNVSQTTIWNFSEKGCFNNIWIKSSNLNKTINTTKHKSYSFSVIIVLRNGCSKNLERI